MSDMTFPTRPLARLANDDRRILLVLAAFGVLLIQGLALSLTLSISPLFSDRQSSWLVGLSGITYTLALFVLIYPLCERRPYLHWLIAAFNGVGILLLTNQLNYFSSPLMAIAWVGAFVVVSALLAGRGPTYLLIFLSAGMVLSFPIPIAIDRWMNMIGILALFLMISETILLLSQSLNDQMRRHETINHVARRLASTIEIREVISLVSEAIQIALLADTYYVGLLNGDVIRLELLYDDGEFFPPSELPIDKGLVGWMMRNKKSLLMDNVIKQVPKLGIELRVVGKPKSSLSWMGTPLESGGRLIGMVAVASYQKNAFKPADLELLESVAKQAALAIDNAYHHAEVEEQSRRDSLTQAYNHGYFLEMLSIEAERARREQGSLSLIMMDIDHFKEFNDKYGHLVGDMVLRATVSSISSHIKKDDLVGRWGGEEFAVCLPGANGRQAMKVAERIRCSLANFSLEDQSGRLISPPTVSQGIAVYPIESTNIESFVHMADQRLFTAKERGRNQIEPDEDFWDHTSNDHQSRTSCNFN
jgi:diguanylate cyclase (GGDEF)-like protein